MRYFILGAGSWGCTIAQLLNDNGHDVLLWAHTDELAAKLSETKAMPHVPDVKLDVPVTSDISNGKFFDVIVIATPTQFIRNVLEKIDYKPNVVLNLSKGIEISTGKRISEIVSEILGCDYAILSGPSHAEEVALRLPTAVVVAGKYADIFQKEFSNEYFRVYLHNDITGIELAGALKNVIAIAAGIVDGLGGWDNAKAALITRGLYEITKFSTHFGADPITFMGLAGIGDLVVTCGSKHSRNRRYGEMIAKGFDPIHLLDASKEIVEGAYTCKAVVENYGNDFDLPIIKEIYQVIYNGKSPLESIKSLMTRSLKVEMEEVKKWLEKNLKN
uniref:Glycerol-3-phosphate dehydrogenase [NAD(P)+] n=1 Tax=Fervidobacterium nodosum TaxID=2424 RepID=A0A7C5U923_9BACT